MPTSAVPSARYTSPAPLTTQPCQAVVPVSMPTTNTSRPASMASPIVSRHARTLPRHTMPSRNTVRHMDSTPCATFWARPCTSDATNGSELVISRPIRTTRVGTRPAWASAGSKARPARRAGGPVGGTVGRLGLTGRIPSHARPGNEGEGHARPVTHRPSRSGRAGRSLHA
ncbi:hypothetical protein ACFQDE_02400 [Deinococcus caeni]|uniref:hypothetical protein n=1 Tax=Deinococcus caeni TaxID=569127 RepID=UPI0036221125